MIFFLPVTPIYPMLPYCGSKQFFYVFFAGLFSLTGVFTNRVPDFRVYLYLVIKQGLAFFSQVLTTGLICQFY